MRLVFAHGKWGERRILLDLLERIVSFCQSFHSDADPYILAEAAAEAYFSESPGMIMFAAVDDSGKVVAHLLASMEDYYGKKSVNVIQYWKDSGVKLPDHIYAGFWSFVNTWAEFNGAEDIKMTARNRAVADVLAKHGFTETGRVLMSRPVK